MALCDVQLVKTFNPILGVIRMKAITSIPFRILRCLSMKLATYYSEAEANSLVIHVQWTILRVYLKDPAGVLSHWAPST